MSWTTGLCQCTMDVSSCFDHMCCFCCNLGRQCAASDRGNQQKDTMPCGLCLISLMCPIISVCQIRRRVVEIYSIDEGCPTSCCCSLLFAGCSACQTHRELTARGTWPGGACCHKQPADFKAIK